MKFLRLLVVSLRQWLHLDMGLYAAAFSYYAPFALIPLVLFSIASLGYFYSADFIRNLFFSWGSVLGPDLLDVLRLAVLNLDTEVQTYQVPIIAILFFLSVTIFAFNSLAAGFGRIYGETARSVGSWIRQSVRSVALVVVLQFFFIYIITLEALWAQVPATALGFVPPLVWFLSISCFFAILFRHLVVGSPSVAGCAVGGLVTGVLFILAKYLVGFYITAKPAVTIFGAAGLLLILLIWIYVLAAIMYYGSIVAKRYDTMYSLPDSK